MIEVFIWNDDDDASRESSNRRTREWCLARMAWRSTIISFVHFLSSSVSLSVHAEYHRTY